VRNVAAGSAVDSASESEGTQCHARSSRFFLLQEYGPAQRPMVSEEHLTAFGGRSRRTSPTSWRSTSASTTSAGLFMGNRYSVGRFQDGMRPAVFEHTDDADHRADEILASRIMPAVGIKSNEKLDRDHLRGISVVSEAIPRGQGWVPDGERADGGVHVTAAGEELIGRRHPRRSPASVSLEG